MAFRKRKAPSGAIRQKDKDDNDKEEDEKAWGKEKKASKRQIKDEAGVLAVKSTDKTSEVDIVDDKSITGASKSAVAYSEYGIDASTTNKNPLKGAVAAKSFLKRTSIFDYAPDRCKDYAQTGYCGYGDSCKFLHERSEQRMGFLLDNDWKKMQKNKGDMTTNSETNDTKTSKELPFACFICRKPWMETQDVVVTTCGHYFCGKCAMDAESTKCPICQVETNGIFHVADKLKLPKPPKGESEDSEDD
jgi:RING finger protein 113A